MRYKELGRTGLKVSEVCLGCMTLGAQADEKESTLMINRALDAGVNFFDTADVYASGRSEEILGKALESRRHKVVLATKVGRPKEGSKKVDLSPQHIAEAVDASLSRLKTDYIDLYQVHHPDPDILIEETLKALDKLVCQGKVRHIGCSNFAARQLGEALSVSSKGNFARFESVQPRYSLITRDIERELLPLCAREKIGVIVYNPLAGGLLTGKHIKGKPPAEGTRFALRQSYRERYWYDRNFDAVEHLRQIAQARGKNLPQFAISWVLFNPTVTSAIIGATSLAQLEENLGAVSLTLTEEESKACDKVWESLQRG